VVMVDGSVLAKIPPNPNSPAALGMIGGPAGGRIYDAAIAAAGRRSCDRVLCRLGGAIRVVLDRARLWRPGRRQRRASRTISASPPHLGAGHWPARAFSQAQKFGADIMIPMAAKSLDCTRTEGTFALALDGGDKVRARAIVVASGARYRRPEIETSINSKAVASVLGLADRGAAVRGAGDCAGRRRQLRGQAAVFLSGHTRKIYMIIRAAVLAPACRAI